MPSAMTALLCPCALFMEAFILALRLSPRLSGYRFFTATTKKGAPPFAIFERWVPQGTTKTNVTDPTRLRRATVLNPGSGRDVFHGASIILFPQLSTKRNSLIVTHNLY